LPPLGFLSTASFALPISITIPPLLADLWESVLRAVPKKKTSHMKKRHRQMAGKALKDAQNLNKCPGCGQVKRAHVLCPTCVKGTTRHLSPLNSESGTLGLGLPGMSLRGKLQRMRCLDFLRTPKG
jgi:large subunit ribosomal protein L32